MQGALLCAGVAGALLTIRWGPRLQEFGGCLCENQLGCKAVNDRSGPLFVGLVVYHDHGQCPYVLARSLGCLGCFCSRREGIAHWNEECDAPSSSCYIYLFTNFLFSLRSSDFACFFVAADFFEGLPASCHVPNQGERRSGKKLEE